MLILNKETKIFVSLTPVDMRKSINGLSALILDVFSESPQSNHFFLFYNKQKNKVKAIFWDRNGFVLYYKRIEKTKFKFNFSLNEEVLEITESQLSWLLAGLDFHLMHQFNDLNYSEFY